MNALIISGVGLVLVVGTVVFTLLGMEWIKQYGVIMLIGGGVIGLLGAVIGALDQTKEHHRTALVVGGIAVIAAVAIVLGITPMGQ